MVLAAATWNRSGSRFSGLQRSWPLATCPHSWRLHRKASPSRWRCWPGNWASEPAPAANAPLIKSLARLTVFGLARSEGDVYALRLAFPPLARRHLRRLAPHLFEAHRLLTEAPPPASEIAAVAQVGRC